MQTRFRLTPVVRVGFGIILASMAFIGGVSIITTKALIETSERVAHTWEVKAKIRQIGELVLDAETGARGYIFADQEELLEPYITAQGVIDDNLAELGVLIGDVPAQQARLEQLQQLTQAKFDTLADVIRLNRTGEEEALRALVLSGKGNQITQEIRTLINEMEEGEQVLLEERQDAASRAEAVSTLITIGGTLSAIALGLAILIFIARQVVRPINDIALNSQQISLTSKQQAVAVQQVVEAMNTLNRSSQENASGVSQIKTGIQQLREAALNLKSVV